MTIRFNAHRYWFTGLRVMQHRAGLLLIAMMLMAGCTSNVRVEQTFPVVVAEPRDLNAVLVITREFRTYTATPNEKTSIQIGTAQVDLMTKAFSGLFAKVTVVSTRDQAGPDNWPA